MASAKCTSKITRPNDCCSIVIDRSVLLAIDRMLVDFVANVPPQVVREVTSFWLLLWPWMLLSPWRMPPQLHRLPSGVTG